MKKTIVIATVLALTGAGAGFAVGAATFARADDHTAAHTEVVRTAVRSEPAPPLAIPAPAPAAPATAPAVVAPSPSRVAPARAEVRVRRLVVTRGIEAREPIDAIDEVDALETAEQLDRVHAFVELANAGEGAGTVTVTFERDGGPTTGIVSLDVPPGAARWRTWAFSRGVDREGAWTAVVRDEGGRVLAEQPFVVR